MQGLKLTVHKFETCLTICVTEFLSHSCLMLMQMQQFGVCFISWWFVTGLHCSSNQTFSWRRFESSANLVSLFLIYNVEMKNCCFKSFYMPYLKIVFGVGTCASGNFPRNLRLHCWYVRYLAYTAYRNPIWCSSKPFAGADCLRDGGRNVVCYSQGVDGLVIQPIAIPENSLHQEDRGYRSGRLRIIYVLYNWLARCACCLVTEDITGLHLATWL